VLLDRSARVSAPNANPVIGQRAIDNLFKVGELERLDNFHFVNLVPILVRARSSVLRKGWRERQGECCNGDEQCVTHHGGCCWGAENATARNWSEEGWYVAARAA